MQDGGSKTVPALEEKKAELVQKVNALVNASFIGVDELKDVVKTYFDVCAIIEAKADGQNPTVLNIIGQVLPGVLPALVGMDQIPAEVSDLQDDEILAELVALGDGYKLGDSAPKYKQVLKMLLFAVQTFFLFKV